jgi:hypothetical protein
MFAIITRVGKFLVSIANTAIKWPTIEEVDICKQTILVAKGFPNVAGK